MPALPGKIRLDARRGPAVTDTAKAAARRIRSSPAWKTAREMKLAAQPLCENPRRLHDGRTVPATQVHHIRRLELAPHLAFTAANLMSVCSGCHSVLSEEERRRES